MPNCFPGDFIGFYSHQQSIKLPLLQILTNTSAVRLKFLSASWYLILCLFCISLIKKNEVLFYATQILKVSSQ